MNFTRKQHKFLYSLSLILLVISLVMNNFSAVSAIAASTPLSASAKQELENQLKELEKQIAEFESQLKNTQNEKNTLANKIKTLKTEQAKLQAQIQSTNVLIDNLESQITETVDSITAAQNKSDRLKAQISETIFSLYEKDGKTLASSLASEDGLAGFFREIDNTQKLSETLTANLEEIKRVKSELEKKNAQLEDQQEGAKELLSIKAIQSNDLSSKLNEQGALLSQTKGKEAQYSAIISDKKKAAAQIRNEIYGLAGGASGQVTFGQALDIANGVSKLTGVRAAFLLAILTQETNLGKNVGTCNRAGDPPSKSWKVVMKPTRDQEPFKVITSELGLDIDTTAVSCPMKDSKGNQVGWGGGMGPAQFIPSTWMGYRAKVTAITGKPANPWDIRDAFIAAAIKLKADGATKGGNGEWEAAMKYFSGSTNTQFRFYGDNVIAIANKYQANIDALNQ